MFDTLDLFPTTNVPVHLSVWLDIGLYVVIGLGLLAAVALLLNQLVRRG